MPSANANFTRKARKTTTVTRSHVTATAIRESHTANASAMLREYEMNRRVRLTTLIHDIAKGRTV